jgi:hypothetical protein
MARLMWFVAVVFVALPFARAEAAEGSVPKQLWLFLSPEEHFCAGPAPSWHDASDPLSFAAGVTARLDQHELWAAGGLPPLLAFRYDTGVLRLLFVGAPTPTKIGITRPASRSSWPFC